LLVLGVLGTGVAYVAWFWSLGRSSLVRLGSALFLIPVVGVVAGVFTGDRPAPVELAGILTVLIGIGLVTRPAGAPGGGRLSPRPDRRT
jgi:drug/metabolite transporter (DMT)-like permease